eukprot:g69760.t1
MGLIPNVWKGSSMSERKSVPVGRGSSRSVQRSVSRGNRNMGTVARILAFVTPAPFRLRPRTVDSSFRWRVFGRLFFVCLVTASWGFTQFDSQGFCLLSLVVMDPVGYSGGTIFEPVKPYIVPHLKHGEAVDKLAMCVGVSSDREGVSSDREGILKVANYIANKPVKYTQQPSRRWSGIQKKVCPHEGHYMPFADCSGLVSWVYWTAFGKGHDFVNGLGWQGGFTGTMRSTGRGNIVPFSKALPGDILLHGNRWGQPYHVTIYMGNHMVLSHGSKAHPPRIQDMCAGFGCPIAVIQYLPKTSHPHTTQEPLSTGEPLPTGDPLPPLANPHEEPTAEEPDGERPKYKFRFRWGPAPWVFLAVMAQFAIWPLLIGLITRLRVCVGRCLPASDYETPRKVTIQSPLEEGEYRNLPSRTPVPSSARTGSRAMGRMSNLKRTPCGRGAVQRLNNVLCPWRGFGGWTQQNGAQSTARYKSPDAVVAVHLAKEVRVNELSFSSKSGRGKKRPNSSMRQPDWGPAPNDQNMVNNRRTPEVARGNQTPLGHLKVPLNNLRDSDEMDNRITVNANNNNNNNADIDQIEEHHTPEDYYTRRALIWRTPQSGQGA